MGREAAFVWFHHVSLFKKKKTLAKMLIWTCFVFRLSLVILGLWLSCQSTHCHSLHCLFQNSLYPCCSKGRDTRTQIKKKLNAISLPNKLCSREEGFEVSRWCFSTECVSVRAPLSLRATSSAFFSGWAFHRCSWYYQRYQRACLFVECSKQVVLNALLLSESFVGPVSTCFEMCCSQ